MKKLLETIKPLIYPALCRAIRTVGQVFVAAVGSATMMHEVNWAVIGSTVCLSFICSLVTSISLGMPETPIETK